jgi:hypothetical protein
VFRNVIQGSSQRSALTTAQALARNANGFAKLEGHHAANEYLLKAAQEVRLPDPNMRLAWRPGDQYNTGVIGVQSSTGTGNNVKYACVFANNITDVDESRLVARAAGTEGQCPRIPDDGDMNASDVLASATMVYTNDLSGLGGGGGGGGADDIVVVIYVCDGASGAGGGGSWDDFVLTGPSGIITSANFDSLSGDLDANSPWLAVSTVNSIFAGIRSLGADGSVVGHPGGAGCTGADGAIGLVQAPDSGTFSFEAKLASEPSPGALVAMVVFNTTGNSVPTEMIVMDVGAGGLSGILMKSPFGGGDTFGFTPGPFVAGDTIKLEYDVAANTTTVYQNGTSLGSFTP